MYDAIIVGARCAGSPTAMLLARQGFKVLLVDRATFPSDTISTHILWPHGAEILARWGLLATLAATGAPPIGRHMTFDVGSFALRGAIPDANDGMGGFCPRRTVLDSLLANAAAEAGVEVREGFTVDELMVIGADGVNSFVARAVRAPEYDVRPVAACGYYSYFSGVRQDDIELYVRDYHAFGGAPTNDGLHLVMVNWPAKNFPAVRTDIEGHVWRALESAPDRNERVRPMYEFTDQLAAIEPPSARDAGSLRRATWQPGRHQRLFICDNRRHSAARFHVERESRPHHGCREGCGVPEMTTMRGVMSCT